MVDASVAVKLYLPEDLTDITKRLFRELQGGQMTFFVPDLFFSECANIFWKSVRRFDLSPNFARSSLRTLIALPLLAVSSPDLLLASLDLALDHQITAYDASYVALAQELGLPLVTADRKLFDKFVESGTDICWLGDLSL